MRKSITMLLLAVGVVSPAAGQTGYVFNTPFGDWHNALNWTPFTGVAPMCGDTAIILANQTCVVGIADECAAVIDVRAGTNPGVLRIQEHKLTISANSTVNGRVELIAPTSVIPELAINDNLTISGTGVIRADAPADEMNPALDVSINVGKTLTLASGLTVRGSVEFKPAAAGNATLINNGLCLVDVIDEVMVLCDVGSRTLTLGGTGTFQVSSGKISVHNVTAMAPNNALHWKVLGPGYSKPFDWFPCSAEEEEPLLDPCVLRIAPPATGMNAWNHGSKFTVTGGWFLIERDVCASGDFTWSGGKIEVLAVPLAAEPAHQLPPLRAKFKGTCP